MAQLKRCTKQESGLLWEQFCVMWLRAKGYGECWMIGDTPEEVLKELNLSRRDFGIDIVVKHENGYFAVQAKWRSGKPGKKTALTWNQLSTFYALCARSGPWLKYIVMTNCDSVRRLGKKWKMDQTIVKAGFRGCKREVWQSIAGLSVGYSLLPVDGKNESSDSESDDSESSSGSDSDESEPVDEVSKQRLQRQAFLDKLAPK
jgi:hypothetical protein